VSPVKYELGFYIPEDDILHCGSREHLKSYITFLLLVLFSIAIAINSSMTSKYVFAV
jgi:hypothetical protein